jgi:hypothetical protein
VAVAVVVVDAVVALETAVAVVDVFGDVVVAAGAVCVTAPG